MRLLNEGKIKALGGCFEFAWVADHADRGNLWATMAAVTLAAWGFFVLAYAS